MSHPNHKNSTGNVTVLPESDETTLCLRFQGIIQPEDAEIRIYQPLDTMVKNGKPFGLLIHYSKDYKGWNKDAANRSFQSVIDHGKYARKLAYVNPPEAKVFQVKMAPSLFGGEVRFFEEKELVEALKWIKS